MNASKPSFDFPEKIHNYERAEMIRIEELIENFKWVQKLSLQLGTVGQGLFKGFQKMVVKMHTPPDISTLSFNHMPYANNLEEIVSEFGASNEKLFTAIADLAANFQTSVEKTFSSTNSQIMKLKKDYQKTASMKQQYAEISHEILNMELGCSGCKMDRAIAQAKTKAYKLKQIMDADEKTYKESIAAQHSSLEEIDWAAMCFIAEATSLVGEYFAGLTKELEQISSVLQMRAQTDKSMKIMKEFAAYIAALPVPQLVERSSEVSPTTESALQSPNQGELMVQAQDQAQTLDQPPSPVEEKEPEQRPESEKETEQT